MFDRELFRRRREAVLSKIEDGVAIVPGSPVARRNGDVEFHYRPDSDLFYLTGFTEPGAVAVLSRVHAEHRYVLFVRPRDRDKEVWTGRRAGVEGAVAEFGADAAFPIEALAAELPKYVQGAQTLYYRLGDQSALDARIIESIASLRARARTGVVAPRRVEDLGSVVHEMRLLKSPEEIAALRRSAAATQLAHLAAMREARVGMREYEVQAIVEYHFRRAGGEPGYYPIVASGPNACVLHYHHNDRAIARGDLLLIDAGAEIDFYTADVTRTFPVRGAFDETRRAVYDVVLAAQTAALALVRPGATLLDLHGRALDVLVRGMVDLGLLPGPVVTSIESEAYKRFYMHRTSHWLGMDVHDAGRYFESGRPRALEPGMVITVEPGLYVAPDDVTVDARWRGIGVRIEDDVLVTPSGGEVLTDGIPREIRDIEALCAP